MGIDAEGLGRDHWNEMLAYPRKPIAHWHSLVEVKKSFKEVGEVALGPGHVGCMGVRAGEWQWLLRGDAFWILPRGWRGRGMAACFSPRVAGRKRRKMVGRRLTQGL